MSFNLKKSVCLSLGLAVALSAQVAFAGSFADGDSSKFDDGSRVVDGSEGRGLDEVVGSFDAEKGRLIYSKDGIKLWAKVISSSYIDEDGIEHECDPPKMFANGEFEEYLKSEGKYDDYLRLDDLEEYPELSAAEYLVWVVL